MALDVLFGADASPAVKQLSGLVDRLSYLGACELLLSPDEISIISTVKSLSSPSSPSAGVLDPSVAGALLERQLDSLEPSRWKEGMHDVFVRLFKDVLGVYAEVMPVRRARVLIRCMAFVYREQTEDMYSALGFKDVEEMAQEVENLAAMEVNSHTLYGITKV